ncbi:MAG: hypothetical protein ACFFD4_25690, partial [Candidatus Odinarchaeota archaeon]
SLMQIGLIHQAKGEYDTVYRYYEQALSIREKAANNIKTAETLFKLVVLQDFLEHESRKKDATAYLMRLREIRNREDFRIVELQFRLAEAIIQKFSGDESSMSLAQVTFQQFAYGEIIDYELTVFSMLNYVEVLFERHVMKEEEDLLSELQKSLEDLQLLVEAKKMSGVLLSALLLRGKLEMVLMNVNKARSFFQEVVVQAKKTGHNRLAWQGEEELAKLSAYILGEKLQEMLEEEKDRYRSLQIDELRSYLNEIKKHLKLQA